MNIQKQLFFLGLILSLAACKKESNTITSEDDTYRQKFESLIHPQRSVTNTSLDTSKLPHISIEANFKSYKEAYNYFRTLETGRVTFIDSVPRKVLPGTNKAASDYSETDQNTTANLYAFIFKPSMTQSSTLIDGTVNYGAFTFTLSYHVSATLQYVDFGIPPHVTMNEVSAETASYITPGATVPTFYSGPNFVVSDGETINTGKILGVISIFGTVNGLAYNFFIGIQGSYNFNLPFLLSGGFNFVTFTSTLSLTPFPVNP